MKADKNTHREAKHVQPMQHQNAHDMAGSCQFFFRSQYKKEDTSWNTVKKTN
ncbi:hypothetical protein HMPREF1254_1043 [Prevotella sp. BV3P1]|nr:hypothetical protein HMPREF1254_1043 [Prevotella sp. BV3P1]